MIKRIFLLMFIVVFIITFAWAIEIDLAAELLKMEELTIRQNNSESINLISMIFGLGSIWVMILLVMCHNLEQIPQIKQVKKSWNRRIRK